MTPEEKQVIVKKFAADALQVQDACNASGVIGSLFRTFDKLRNEGIGWANYPPFIMFADKLDDLCRCRSLPLLLISARVSEFMDEFMAARDAVNAIREKEGIKEYCLDTDTKNTHPTIQECVRKLAAYTNSRHVDFIAVMTACEKMKETGEDTYIA